RLADLGLVHLLQLRPSPQHSGHGAARRDRRPRRLARRTARQGEHTVMTAMTTPPDRMLTEREDAGFQRRLGPFDATMLVVGTMIGSGIFVTSQAIASDVGSAGWLLAVWAVAGVMTILGALSYAELAAMMPHAGGQY